MPPAANLFICTYASAVCVAWFVWLKLYPRAANRQGALRVYFAWAALHSTATILVYPLLPDTPELRVAGWFYIVSKVLLCSVTGIAIVETVGNWLHAREVWRAAGVVLVGGGAFSAFTLSRWPTASTQYLFTRLMGHAYVTVLALAAWPWIVKLFGMVELLKQPDDAKSQASVRVLSMVAATRSSYFFIGELQHYTLLSLAELAIMSHGLWQYSDSYRRLQRQRRRGHA